MTTTDTVLLIILTSLLSVFFILCIALVVCLLKFLANVRRVVERAEEVVGSVESAAEIFKDTQGRLAFFKLVRNIVKLMQKGSRK
jgi:hypothetical protein